MSTLKEIASRVSEELAKNIKLAKEHSAAMTMDEIRFRVETYAMFGDETAAPDWWTRMSPSQQREYKRKHPRSKVGGPSKVKEAQPKSEPYNPDRKTRTAPGTHKVELPSTLSDAEKVREEVREKLHKAGDAKNRNEFQKLKTQFERIEKHINKLKGNGAPKPSKPPAAKPAAKGDLHSHDSALKLGNALGKIAGVSFKSFRGDVGAVTKPAKANQMMKVLESQGFTKNVIRKDEYGENTTFKSDKMTVFFRRDKYGVHISVAPVALTKEQRSEKLGQMWKEVDELHKMDEGGKDADTVGKQVDKINKMRKELRLEPLDKKEWQHKYL